MTQALAPISQLSQRELEILAHLRALGRASAKARFRHNPHQDTPPPTSGGVPAPVYRGQGLSRGFQGMSPCERTVRTGFTRMS
jgi:hypothetical protein